MTWDIFLQLSAFSIAVLLSELGRYLVARRQLLEVRGMGVESARVRRILFRGWRVTCDSKECEVIYI